MSLARVLARQRARTVAFGALAGIVITILFLYFSGATTILGAGLRAAVKDLRKDQT